MAHHLNVSVRLASLPLVIAAGTVVGPAPTWAGADPPIEVIDALVHTSFDDSVIAVSKVAFSRQELAREMERNHVVGAVAMNRPGDRSADLSDLNVVNCASLAVPGDVAALETGLASREFRCVTIYLGYVEKYAYDPVYEPTYRLAERYHVPVVLYFGGGARKYLEPHTAGRVARSHPGVTFVLAHAADPRTVAERARDAFLQRGDPLHYLSFANETQIAADVAAGNPNVVLDGSGVLIGDLGDVGSDQIEAYLVRPVHAAFVKVGNPAKFMFGTGWPVTDVARTIEAFKRAIPPEYWRAVLHDNAARVYGFGGAASTRE